MATLVNGKVLKYDLIIVGGDDMRYTFVNSTDYKSDNISAGVKYQLQAIHRTKVYHYNDTLDMLVVSKKPSMTTLRVQQSCMVLFPSPVCYLHGCKCRHFLSHELKEPTVMMDKTIKTLWDLSKDSVCEFIKH